MYVDQSSAVLHFHNEIGVDRVMSGFSICGCYSLVDVYFVRMIKLFGLFLQHINLIFFFTADFSHLPYIVYLQFKCHLSLSNFFY